MGDIIDRATALHRRALDHFDRGRTDTAHREMLSALALLDEAPVLDETPLLDETLLPNESPPEQETPQDQETNGSAAARARLSVRVLISLFNLEAELRIDGLGEARLQRAHQIVADLVHAKEQLVADDLSFDIENARGLRSLREGKVEVALDHFTRAEVHLDQAPVEDACVLLLNRGTLHLQQLSLGLARADLDHCLVLTEASESDSVRLRNLEFMARHNLGYLEFLAGNIPAALLAMDRAAGLPIDGSRAISYLDKARVLLAAGLVDAADETMIAASTEFRQSRLHQELAETELSRAEAALLALDWQAARSLAGSARTRFRRRGNDRWRRIAELILLQADLAGGRPPSRLVAAATRLEQEFKDHGLDQQGRIAGLIACSALSASQRLAEARTHYATIHPIEEADPITVKVHQRSVAAELALRGDDRQLARREIRRGLQELTRHQSQFGSVDLQTSSAIHGRQLVELDLETALSSGRPDALFNAIERGRAMSRRLTSVTPPSAESSELLAELRHLTEIIRAINNDPDATGTVHHLRERTRAIYAELSSISWRVLGEGHSTDPSPMSRVRAEVERRDLTMVTLSRLHDTWAGVVLGEGPPRLVQLPEAAQTPELVRRAQADLNVLAFRSLPGELRNTVTTSLRRTMQRLDEILIAPLHLADRPLVLVPTGDLATFNWSGLPSFHGRPTMVSPTATSWLAKAQALSGADDQQSVEVLAGPGLITAGAEVDDVARAWQGSGQTVKHTGSEATRDSMTQALASATVVHVAAHGSHERQNPLFSSLQLADGPLFAYEIEPGHIAPHIVLSACELGQNTLRAGDETLGLTSVLLQLGSRSVVSGVAQVGDDTARTVMSAYHRRLATGSDAATALAEAIAAADEPFVPFVCFGASWSVEPQERGGNKPTSL